jgi:hypothetical protein
VADPNLWKETVMAKVLKTPVAYDEDGNPYPADKIDALFPQLNKMNLRSIGLAPVKPRKSGKKRAHYRLKPSDDIGVALERTERKPTHNETVNILLSALTNAKADAAFYANGFGGAKTLIFSLPRGTRYRWVREPETRYWVDAIRYIQPDLLGWDGSRFSSGPRNPGVIIEVVYTHLPEFDTWLALEELSKRNHIVLFFFVRPGFRMNFLNGVNASNKRPPLEINVEYYLQNGCLFKGKKDVTPDANKSDQDRYDDIVKTMLPAIMAKLKKLCKPASTP